MFLQFINIYNYSPYNLDKTTEILPVQGKIQIDLPQNVIPQTTLINELNLKINPLSNHEIKITENEDLSNQIQVDEHKIIIPQISQTLTQTNEDNIDFNIDYDPSTFSNIQVLTWEMKNQKKNLSKIY